MCLRGSRCWWVLEPNWRAYWILSFDLDRLLVSPSWIWLISLQISLCRECSILNLDILIHTLNLQFYLTRNVLESFYLSQLLGSFSQFLFPFFFLPCWCLKFCLTFKVMLFLFLLFDYYFALCFSIGCFWVSLSISRAHLLRQIDLSLSIFNAYYYSMLKFQGFWV